MGSSRGRRIFAAWALTFISIAGLVLPSNWLRQAAPAPPPRSLENIRLAQASTLELLIDQPQRFPIVNLRALVGPVGCRIGRIVSLHRVVAGSASAVPLATAPATNSSGHAVFTNIPNVRGDQYQAVVADDPAGCDGAISNVVTLPGPV